MTVRVVDGVDHLVEDGRQSAALETDVLVAGLSTRAGLFARAQSGCSPARAIGGEQVGQAGSGS